MLGFRAYQLASGVTLPTEAKEFLPVLPTFLDLFGWYPVLTAILSIMNIGAVKAISYLGVSMNFCSYCLHLLLRLGEIFEKIYNVYDSQTRPFIHKLCSQRHVSTRKSHHQAIRRTIHKKYEMLVHILGPQKACNIKIGKFVTVGLSWYIRCLFQIVSVFKG